MLSGYGIPPMDVRIGGLYSHGLQQLNFNELLMTNPLPSIPLPSIPEQPYAHPHPETLRARVDQNSPEESHVSVEEGKEKKMTSYNRSKTNVVRREKTICGVCKFKKCSCDQPLPCTECRRIYRENAERICIPYHRGWSELRECLYQSRLIPKPATNGESGSRLVIHHDPQLVAELTPKVHQNATMEPPVPRLSVLEIETYCIRQERHVAYDALLSQTMDGFIDHGEFIIRFKDHVDLGNLESAIINYCFMYQVQNPDANTQVRNLIDSMLTLFNIEGDCLVELDGDERFRMQHGAIKINEEFTPRPSARALSQLSERLSKLRGSLLSKVMEGLEEITHGIIEKKIAQDSSCVPVEFCAELLILYCRNKVQQYQESSTQRSCYQKVVDYFSLQHWSLKRPRKLAPAQFEMLLLGRIRKLEDLYYKEENGSSIDAVHRELMKSSKKRRPGKHGGPKNKNEQKTDNHNNSQSVVHSSQNQHRHTQRQRNRRQKRLNQTQIEGAQMFNYEIFCCTPIPMANTEVAETLHGRMETDDRNNNGHYYNMTGTHDLGECVNAKCTIQ
ncbi:hypothetical protein F4810DRAFT_656204 [Camillea tinctor]|nr:hypothetical protein F4810DRAFT_656204 [Camillea tinctor]